VVTLPLVLEDAIMFGWNLVGALIVGLLAGWLGGLLMRGRGFGCLGNLLIGAIGGLVGGFLFRLAGIEELAGFLGSLLTALVGAIVLLAVTSILRKVTR
jgi:uncharacterized membrane protein YeaQ/YmgE (transglycosylase-associated protein family)